MSGTLLIDNYDSFTYNLYALIAETSGQPPIVVRNDEMEWVEVLARGVDRIVISAGPGRPQRRSDLGLSADAILSNDLPILGVCLGHQAIAHFFGAEVVLAREPVHGRRCRITHLGVDLFEGIPSPFNAVRYHSLAVTRLPSHLQATAWAEDGTIMGLRHRTRPVWGVQFHPESIRTEHGATLIRRFLDLTPPRGVTGKDSQQTASGVAAAVVTPSSRVFAHQTSVRVDSCVAFTALYRRCDTAFWLDSSLRTNGAGRFSYMGDASGPRAEIVQYKSAARKVEIIRQQSVTSKSEDVFSYLGRELAARFACTADVPFDFTGGYVGYFGYELAAELLGHSAPPADTPDACWIFADRVIAFDHDSGAIWLLCVDDLNGMCAENRAWVRDTERALQNVTHHALEANVTAMAATGSLAWRHSPEAYRRLIGRALNLIRQGETYEVCLTNQLMGKCKVEPLEIYLTLRRVNPAPYSAFLKVGTMSVLCSSPELFLQVAADGTVQSKPIKGTAPRDADPAEDSRRAAQLAASIKDRSENLMIVDLLRNDLNRVCRVGSVHVPEIFSVETYASVHQLVSTVSGQLRPGLSVMDCIRALFPGGSMTGAPKVRTTKILNALEGGPRGVYSGSLGYLSTNHSAQLNIVIRTIVVHGDEITMGTGGAIVALSDPDCEISEMALKITALLQTLQQCGIKVNWKALLPGTGRTTRSAPPLGCSPNSPSAT